MVRFDPCRCHAEVNGWEWCGSLEFRQSEEKWHDQFLHYRSGQEWLLIRSAGRRKLQPNHALTPRRGSSQSLLRSLRLITIFRLQMNMAEPRLTQRLRTTTPRRLRRNQPVIPNDVAGPGIVRNNRPIRSLDLDIQEFLPTASHSAAEFDGV